MEGRGHSDERRRRLTHRGAPALGGAFLVILLIVLIASSGPSPAIGVARRFTHAWERSDYRAMYAMLTPAAQRGIDAAGFTEAYRTAADTATATGVAAGKVSETHGGARVQMAVRTRIFGTIKARLERSMSERARAACATGNSGSSAPQISWTGIFSSLRRRVTSCWPPPNSA